MDNAQIELCRTIAMIAHTAKGQKRADKTTPYIVHPARVVELLDTWFRDGTTTNEYLASNFVADILLAQAAGWLHDVVEDTGVTLHDLMLWGVYTEVIEIVDLLTKKNRPQDPEDAAYYMAIGKNDTALLTKLADRCANLEDIHSEVLQTEKIKRWKPYVDRTKTDFLPYFDKLPFLRNELIVRLDLIDGLIVEIKGGDPAGTFDCGIEVRKNA